MFPAVSPCSIVVDQSHAVLASEFGLAGICIQHRQRTRSFAVFPVVFAQLVGGAQCSPRWDGRGEHSISMNVVLPSLRIWAQRWRTTYLMSINIKCFSWTHATGIVTCHFISTRLVHFADQLTHSVTCFSYEPTTTKFEFRSHAACCTSRT